VLKFEAESGEGFLERGNEPPPYQLGSGEHCNLPPVGFWAEPRLQIHFGPPKNLENESSCRKCRAQFNFLLSTGSPAEPLDTTGRTLRFCGTPFENIGLMLQWFHLSTAFFASHTPLSVFGLDVIM